MAHLPPSARRTNTSAPLVDWGWTINTERDRFAPRGRPYLSRATLGRETVWGRHAPTAELAEASLRERLLSGGYAR